MVPFTSFRVTNFAPSFFSRFSYCTVSFPFMPSARCGRQ
jgi:hypothetical protein